MSEFAHGYVGRETLVMRFWAAWEQSVGTMVLGFGCLLFSVPGSSSRECWPSPSRGSAFYLNWRPAGSPRSDLQPRLV